MGVVGLGRAALVVGSALALLAGISASAGAAPRPFYGIVPQTALSSGEVERMGEGGIGTLRTVLNWSSVDPTRADDDYLWGGFDALVGDAARSRITVLPFFFGTPDWVARGLDRRGCGDCQIYAPRTRPARAAWRQFVGDAVDRYGRGGEFWAEHPEVPERPIRAWQIWNEQNSSSFYGPRPTVKGYSKLLDAAASAIRSRDRGADVVLGGMAELAGSVEAVTGSKYLRDLYRRRGARRDFDGVAPHPYGATMAATRRQFGRFLTEMARAGDRRTGLWVTEIGWGSASGSNPLELGRRGQARRLSQAYRYFQQRRRRLNVRTVAWFSWRDSRPSICDWCASSGLRTQSGAAKPSWHALRRLTPGR